MPSEKPRMTFVLTAEERANIEAIRVAYALHSHSETLRYLIEREMVSLKEKK